MASLLAIFSAVLNAALIFVKWLFEGLVVCIAHPVTVAVLLVVLVAGFYWGVRHDEAALNKLHTEMVQADENSKKRLEAAETARRDAEAKVMAGETTQPIPIPSTAPVSVKRVRHRPAHNSGSWLPSFSSLWGKSK